MTRIAYLDCVAGISGDMLLGAMLDAGLPLDSLNSELEGIAVAGWSLRAEPVKRGGIAATKAHVDLEEAPQPHRRLPDVLSIIEGSSLPSADKARASAVFDRLAAAEARVHGVATDEIDFHEVGALDAIVDVVGAVVGLRLLGVEQVYCSALPTGGGTVRTAHGQLPVPAPATLQLLSDAGAPIAASSADRPMELVTPTGAAIVATLARFERPQMRLHATGYGAGGRDPEGWPNVLRIWLGDAETRSPTMLLVQTNIDDMNPEIFGYVQELLFAAGAADVWLQADPDEEEPPGDYAVGALRRRTRGRRERDPVARNINARCAREQRVAARSAARGHRIYVEPGACGREGEAPARRGARVAPEYEACRRIGQKHRGCRSRMCTGLSNGKPSRTCRSEPHADCACSRPSVKPASHVALGRSECGASQ